MVMSQIYADSWYIRWSSSWYGILYKGSLWLVNPILGGDMTPPYLPCMRKSQIWHWFISRERNEGNVHDRVITQWLRSNMKTALWTKRNTRALPIPSPVCTDDDAWVRKPISLHALNMCNAVEQQQTRGRGWSVPRYQMSTEPIDRQRSLEWVAGVYPLE